MPRSNTLKHEYVEFIPSRLEQGRLYISREYRTATHLCCCGCGLEVVTPLNPAKWQLTDHGVSVSLRPSIGNWSFPCQSHYWIQRGRVRWAKSMSHFEIAQVRLRDYRAVQSHSEPPTGEKEMHFQKQGGAGLLARIKGWLGSIFG